jgi:hypothetical protein
VGIIAGLLAIAFGVLRVASTAVDLARRRFASGHFENEIGRLNSRQLRDVGLSPDRTAALKDNYASAEAQLGMVR